MTEMNYIYYCQQLINLIGKYIVLCGEKLLHFITTIGEKNE